MITLQQILLAINERILAAFPNVEIQSTDISEGFKRPSFFVDFESIAAAAYGARGRERRIQVTIYYFPSSREQYRIELLEVQEKLEAVFSRSFSIVEGFEVYPFEIDSVKVDGVLQTRFELYLLEVDGTEEGHYVMEELQWNTEKRD